MAPQRPRMEEPRFDVLICGGGMIGATLAWALAGQGLQVAVAERLSPSISQNPTSGPPRVTAINAGSQEILDRLGLWPAIHAASAHPIHSIEVRHGGRHGTALLSPHEAGVDPLGYVVENRALTTASWQRLERSRYATLFCPATVHALRPRARYCQVQLETKGGFSSIRARLVIGADGGYSHIRRLLRIPTRGWHHNRYALVTRVDCQKDHCGQAFDVFLSEGPLAFLPMTEYQGAIIWSLGPHAAVEVMELGSEQLVDRLQWYLGNRLGRLEAPGTRACIPLELQLARRFTASRTALVGNAAHLLHPVAAQGFNLGMRDIATLAVVLQKGQDRGLEAGHPALLGYYARKRWLDTARTVALTEGLHSLFAGNQALLTPLREQGLHLFDHLSPLKHILLRQTVGIGSTPRLHPIQLD